METRLVKLKSDFNDIINIRNTVKNVFDILQVRIDRLRQIYSEFIKTNQSEMFVFGLDSFHFQSKLIDIEYDDMKRLFLAINNRMYCEYFKLHKIIVEYISKTVTDKKISDLVKINNFPIYKDLEPFKEYKFETILDMHENILNLLGILMSIINNKENELLIHKTKQNIGLNIDNFITSFNFNISVMREKILMFITYIDFFHKMHSKYLKRFSNKIQLMYTHISNDIKFDDSVEITKNKKKELLSEFITGNMDKKLLHELKTSIGSETNSESSDGSKSSVNTPNKQKNDYKKIFQKNVHKVTNILQLCKPKKDKIVQPKLTDNEIEEIFYGIEESCDSIINENDKYNYVLENNNIALHIESFDNQDIKANNFIPLNFEEYKSLNGEKNNEEINNSLKIENVILEQDDIIIDEKNESEQPIINDELDISEVITVNEEPPNLDEEPNINEEPIVNEEPISELQEKSKKKRAYNRKKK